MIVDVSPWDIVDLGGGRPDDATIWHASGWSSTLGRIAFDDGLARSYLIPIQPPSDDVRPYASEER